MKNILIIGCGLLGSSLLRKIKKKRIAKKIYIYEKSKANISKIKKLKLPGTIVDKLQDGVIKSDLIIFLGCRAGSVTTEKWKYPSKNKKIILFTKSPNNILGLFLFKKKILRIIEKYI